MLRWIILLPLFVILVLFGVSNRQAVTVQIWPLDYTLAAPLSVVVLICGAVFFLFGAVVAWASGLSYWGRARRAEAKVRALEADLAEFRANAARQFGPVPVPPGTLLARLRRSAA